MLRAMLSLVPRASIAVSAATNASAPKSSDSGPAATSPAPGAAPASAPAYAEKPRATAALDRVTSRIMFHPTLQAASSPKVTDTKL